MHFLNRSNHEAHDILVCIGTGANVADEKRMRYVPELYFKSPEEMRHLFRDYPEAISNTLAIAECCNLEIEFGKPKYPNYTPPEGFTQNAYLRKICHDGLSAEAMASALRWKIRSSRNGWNASSGSSRRRAS